MALAITADHQALTEVARSFLTRVGSREAARSLLDEPKDALPALWAELRKLGWLGLHLPEQYGGSGAGLPELAIVVEELGRGVAPGPFLPTVIASAVIDEAGDDALRAQLLPPLAEGEMIATVGYDSRLDRAPDGSVSGAGGAVLSAELADLFLLPLGDDLVVLPAADLTVTPLDGLDHTRRLAQVTVSGAQPKAVLVGGRAVAVRIGRALAAAEASGGANGTTEMAVEYAKVREQFGRVIGSFQAVKHHCANMLVRGELATAVAWDAARPARSADEGNFAAAIAAALALDAYRRNAELNIQVQGGIGFTWEHDAHLYLRRAAVLAQVFGSVDAASDELLELVRAGVHREPSLDLPPEAEQIRAETRAWVAANASKSPDELRRELASSGYLVPHWPTPYGRAAGAVEQLVIEQEFADIELPVLGIGGWVTLTLLQHGTPEQVERWVGPSLRGELNFCQLFSEPNAGSDAAAVQTRAQKVEGGWQINGQKVWTSGAQLANRGLATVRTDTAAKKHAGITAMVIDMHAAGVEVRPLREITGEALFNEVFFDDVFVPDADVVGEVNGGWTVARATLGNERVTIGSGSSITGTTAVSLLRVLDRHPDEAHGRQIAQLIAREQAMKLLNVRQAARAVAGGPPGPEGNVSKLVGAEHQQRVAELGLTMSALDAVDGGAPALTHAYLMTRCLTIAGGTSEVIRNVIGERMLGLPRDPLVR